MKEPKALVRNAADAEQVAHAAEMEQATEESAEHDLLGVLATYGGRRFLWDRLATLGVNRSVYATGNDIYYRAGRQDAGHELLADILRASAGQYLLMQQEAIDRESKKTTPKRTRTDG